MNLWRQTYNRNECLTISCCRAVVVISTNDSGFNDYYLLKKISFQKIFSNLISTTTTRGKLGTKKIFHLIKVEGLSWCHFEKYVCHFISARIFFSSGGERENKKYLHEKNRRFSEKLLRFDMNFVNENFFKIILKLYNESLIFEHYF